MRIVRHRKGVRHLKGGNLRHDCRVGDYVLGSHQYRVPSGEVLKAMRKHTFICVKKVKRYHCKLVK